MELFPREDCGQETPRPVVGAADEASIVDSTNESVSRKFPTCLVINDGSQFLAAQIYHGCTLTEPQQCSTYVRPLPGKMTLLSTLRSYNLTSRMLRTLQPQTHETADYMRHPQRLFIPTHHSYHSYPQTSVLVSLAPANSSSHPPTPKVDALSQRSGARIDPKAASSHPFPRNSSHTQT